MRLISAKNRLLGCPRSRSSSTLEKETSRPRIPGPHSCFAPGAMPTWRPSIATTSDTRKIARSTRTRTPTCRSGCCRVCPDPLDAGEWSSSPSSLPRTARPSCIRSLSDFLRCRFHHRCPKTFRTSRSRVEGLFMRRNEVMPRPVQQGFSFLVLVLVSCAIVPAANSSPDANAIRGEAHYVMRDGLRIYLWEKHKAGLEGTYATSGKVALLVHGGTWSGRPLFDLQIRDYSLMDFLAENGYDVWAIDLHGYGRSDKTDKDWTDSHPQPPISRQRWAT